MIITKKNIHSNKYIISSNNDNNVYTTNMDKEKNINTHHIKNENDTQTKNLYNQKNKTNHNELLNDNYFERFNDNHKQEEKNKTNMYLNQNACTSKNEKDVYIYNDDQDYTRDANYFNFIPSCERVAKMNSGKNQNRNIINTYDKGDRHNKNEIHDQNDVYDNKKNEDSDSVILCNEDENISSSVSYKLHDRYIMDKSNNNNNNENKNNIYQHNDIPSNMNFNIFNINKDNLCYEEVMKLYQYLKNYGSQLERNNITFTYTLLNENMLQEIKNQNITR